MPEGITAEHAKFIQFTDFLLPGDPDLASWMKHFEELHSPYRLVNRHGLAAIFRPEGVGVEKVKRGPFVHGWKIGSIDKDTVLVHKSGHTIAFASTGDWHFAKEIPERLEKARQGDIDQVNSRFGLLIPEVREEF